MNDPTAREGGARPGRPAPSLKARALRLLALREHSRAELERKLRPHADPPEALAPVLDELQAKGFINEARVADSLVHRKAERFGAARVRAELQAKGLSTELVDGAVQQLRASEAERAQAVWARKFGAPPRDPAERARQMRFLAARGFAAEVVRRVVPAFGADPGGWSD